MKKTLYLLLTTSILSVSFWACQPVSDLPNPLQETSSSGARANGKKVAVIHNGKVIMVNENAVAAHVGHGDELAADFATFYIRNNSNVPLANRISPPWDNNIVLSENAAGDGFSFLTPFGGQKVGYGTNAFDGLQINQIESADWDKVSGLPNDGLLPYLNIWVTDGSNFAVIASEFTAADGDYRGKDFGTRRVWKVFEYSGTNLSWLFDGQKVGARDNSQFLTVDNGSGPIRVTLSEIADNIIIKSPTSPFPIYVGTGAPRGGFGFNLVWGDTQSNFVDNVSTPHQINNLTVKADGNPYTATNF